MGDLESVFLQVAAFAAVVVGTLTGQPWLVAAGVSITATHLSALLAGNLVQRQEGIQLNVASNEASIPVVYGRTKIGLRIVDVRVDTASTDDKDLALVGVLALGGEGGQGIEDVEEVYFDDHLAISNPVFESEPSTSGVQSRYSGFLEYGLHAGADAQTVDAELDSRFTEWGTDSPGKGVAYIALILTYDRDIYPTGIPNVTVVMKGAQVWDPRAGGGAGAWGYSNNAALCVLDYLASQRYGGAAFYPERDGGDTTLSEIDEDSFTAMANYCDEDVAIPPSGTEDRFTCNGWLDTARPVAQNLLELLSACRGALIYQGGKYRLVIRKVTTASAFELNEDNIIGGWEYDVLGSRDVPNVVRATYVDEDQNWQPNTAQWPEADAANAYLTADNGFEVSREIDLPFTQGRYRAGRIAMVHLKEGRGDVVVSVLAMEEALKLQVGDVVKLTHSSPGWTDKEFWVAAVGILPDAKVRLWLQEYDDTAYTLDSQTQADSPPGTELPDPFTVQVPTTLVLTSSASTARDTQDGQRIPVIEVSWTASVHTFLDHYELQYRINAGGQEWIKWSNPAKEDDAAAIYPLKDGQSYQVRLRAVNTLGVRSDWVSDTITASTKPGTAEITHIGGSFDYSDNTCIAHVIGNLPTTNIYINVGAGSSPADPTDSVYDGTIAARSGSVDTGIAISPDQDAYIKARGKNSAGELGPVLEVVVTRPSGDFIEPDFKVEPIQTGNTATLTIVLQDPQSRVTATSFKAHNGPGDYDFSDPDHGSWTKDTTPPLNLTHNSSIQPKHGTVIAAAIRFTDQSGTPVWRIKAHTFDPDQIAEVSNITVSFDQDDHALVAVIGDEDVTDGYIKVKEDSEPAQPTTITNDGSWSGRYGTIDSGVVVRHGHVAHVKVRARNSLNEYGPTQYIEVRNGDAPRVEITAETLAAATLTLTVRSYNGDVEAGIVEHRYKSDAGVWQTDFDGDISNESTEGPKAITRPAYDADPDWVEFRAKVNGKYSAPLRVEIPPQDPPNVWRVDFAGVIYTDTQATIDDAEAFKNDSSSGETLQYKDGGAAWADSATNPNDLVVNRPDVGGQKTVLLAVKDGTNHRAITAVEIAPKTAGVARFADVEISEDAAPCPSLGVKVDLDWTTTAAVNDADHELKIYRRFYDLTATAPAWGTAIKTESSPKTTQTYQDTPQYCRSSSGTDRVLAYKIELLEGSTVVDVAYPDPLVGKWIFAG